MRISSRRDRGTSGIKVVGKIECLPNYLASSHWSFVSGELC